MSELPKLGKLYRKEIAIVAYMRKQLTILNTIIPAVSPAAHTRLQVIRLLSRVQEELVKSQFQKYVQEQRTCTECGTCRTRCACGD